LQQEVEVKKKLEETIRKS